MSVSSDKFITIVGKKYMTKHTSILLNIITLGLFWFLCRLGVVIEIFLKTKNCELFEADCIVVEDINGQKQIYFIERISAIESLQLKRYVMKGYVTVVDTGYGRFIYDWVQNKYVLPSCSVKTKELNEIYRRRMEMGREEEIELRERALLYGRNICGIEAASVSEVVQREIINVVFVWQVIPLCVWISMRYYWYATVVGSIFISLFVSKVIDEINQENELRKMTRRTHIKVIRRGEFTEVWEDELYPLDVIAIETCETFKCDIRILQGDVVVDESFLTGESVSICKGVGSCVYAGTKVLRSEASELKTKMVEMKEKIKKEEKIESKIKKKINTNKDFNIKINNELEVNSNIQGSSTSTAMQKLMRVKNLFGSQSTHLIQPWALGVVIKTGRLTKRGILFRNLLSQKKISDGYEKQSLIIMRWFFGITLILSVVCFLELINDISILEGLKYGLDVALTMFNPALYFCQELSNQHAKRQLQSLGINTVDIKRINRAGEVNTAIFDKTGTLTQLDVDIRFFDTFNEIKENIIELNIIERLAFSTCHSVLELDGKHSGDVLDMKMLFMSQARVINKGGKRWIKLASVKYVPLCREEDDGFLFFDSKCGIKNNNLSININDFINSSNIIDNSNKIDKKFINNKNLSNNNKINFNDKNNKIEKFTIVEILHIYDFDSKLKRMSVILANPSILFCKGAPDSIASICNNIPSNFNERVNEYALQGYRVLALAYRPISHISNRTIDELELKLLGLVVFANQLKPEAHLTVETLSLAGLSIKMCTGDNILTAISVARECGMVGSDTPVLFPVAEEGILRPEDVQWYCVADNDYIFDRVRRMLYLEFDNAESDFIVACEGREYEFLKRHSQEKFILDKGVVFARFDPENKKNLIEDYSRIGHTVLFCGDGANDTGALAAADVGLSLARNEASLAAPFNSARLTAVIDLIREARAALVMSISQFKYSFFVQLLTGLQMLILLFFRSFFSDFMSLFSDLVGFFFLSYGLANFKSSYPLSVQPFSINLIHDIFKISIECFFLFFVFLFCLIFLSHSSTKNIILTNTPHSTILFFLSLFLCLLKAFFYADCTPHRESRTQNFCFIIVYFFSLIFIFGLLFSYLTGNSFIIRIFDFTILTMREKYIFFIISIFICLYTLFYHFYFFKKKNQNQKKN